MTSFAEGGLQKRWRASRTGVRRIFSFFIVLLLWSPSFSPASNPVGDLADDLVSQLTKQVIITGHTVQISSGNFTQAPSGMRPAFSLELEQALATSFASRGVMVSVRETGDRPLCLIGVYRRDGDDLAVTLRLREMGASASRDQAVASGTVRYRDVEALLKNSVQSLAMYLVDDLGKVYTGQFGTEITVSQPVPGHVGDPGIKLGKALKEALEKALTHSRVFGEVNVVPGSGPGLHLVSAYTISNPCGFTAGLVTADGRTLFSTTGKLKKSEIPADLLEMVNDRGLRVCIEYSPLDRRAVPASSPAAGDVLEGVNRALLRVGIEPEACKPGGEGLRVASSLRLQKNMMQDGYGILSGELHLRIFNGSLSAGSVIATGTLPLVSRQEDKRGLLVQKLFAKSVEEDLARQILAYRKTSPTDQ